MVLTTSTPNEIKSQSMRKRKRHDRLQIAFFNNERVSQAISEIKDFENKENSKVLTQFSTNYSTSSECNFNKESEPLTDIEVKEEDLRNTDVETDGNNDSDHSRVTICKSEDLHTESKIEEESIHIESIYVKIETNPQISAHNNLGISSEDCLLQSIKTETELPQKVKCSNANNGTPKKNKRQRLSSDISNYDQLSDRLKIELYNNEHEHIDMLHDFSTIINFGTSNSVTDIFCLTNDNMETNEDAMKSVDPEVNPLSDNENVTVDNEQVQQIKSENIQNTDDNDGEMKDYIKHILGELDIELSETDKSESEQPTRRRTRRSTKSCSYNEPDTLGSDSEVDTSSSKKLSENALEELYAMKIKLLHKIPEQHKVEQTAGTKSLTKSERKRFLIHGPIKKGPYTPEEDKIIKNNWNKFCETHRWNPKCTGPFIKMKNGNKFYIKNKEERLKFAQFLANGLPWRTLYSVYHRFKYLYGDYDIRFKKRYSLDEDKKILSYMNKTKGHKVYVKLSKVLGRSKSAIWKRYQRIKDQQENKKLKSKVKWTLKSLAEFIKTFMDVTLSDSVEDLKDAVIPASVWRKLQEKLHIESHVLMHFWMNQLHMQLFSPKPIYLNDIRIKLIEYVYAKGISSTKEIVWRNVAKYFDGMTTIFLCRTFLYLVREAHFKLKTNNFSDIIDYLFNNKIKLIMNEETDKFLPRLTYQNGIVKIKDKDV